MINFGKAIVKFRVPIFLLSLLLLIPSALGYLKTRVNYDILSYLPADIETMQGQDILVDEFGTGAYSMFVVEGMEYKDVASLKEKLEQVDGVAKILWYDSVMDLRVPVEVLPQEVIEAFNKEDCTMMFIIFSDTTSSDETMDAINEIRHIAGKQCFLSGMSAVVTDTKSLSEKETPMYVVIAVILSTIVLSLTMDSFLIPVFFLLSIGFSIIYNLGSNIVFGEISYITKALTAVLQLGVTMDYSIFLWHSYEEQKERFDGDKERAMAHAIKSTISSVIGSSITTIAGFIALCFMSFTLGLDLGVVMAKGVIFGVICCITVLPSMILLFDKALTKTRHKPLLPDMPHLSSFISKHYMVFVVLFVVLLIPALYGYRNTKVYYNLDSTLPESLPSIEANAKLNETFEMNSIHMALIPNELASKDINNMVTELKNVDGINWVLGLDSVLGPGIPQDFLPESLTGELQSDNWKLLLINSQYKVATDEVNNQCSALSAIIKSYNPKGMLVGEAPCTKDLITITDKDFKTVSIVSIGAIFLIILLVFKSISLPVVLVAVIELAIFINMGIPFYTNTTIPFIASVVIGTIQLGATVDYAILMTTRYKRERSKGASCKDAVTIAHQASTKSIIVSALSFFAATFGVAVYSSIDMISSLCNLMTRGAIISMLVVIFVLPAMLILFDKITIHTSIGFKD